MKKVIIVLAVAVVGIVSVALFFRDTNERVTTNGNETAMMSCSEFAKLARQNASETILAECNKYFDKTCTTDNDCGAFPCQNNKCLIRPCSSDNDCPDLCGLHATPVPGFCTTIDVQ